MNDIYITTDFKLREFESPDTHQVIIDHAHIYRLQLLRTIVDAPFIITSGYRTISHNTYVGGSKNSFHLYGKATDIKITDFDVRALCNIASHLLFIEVIPNIKEGYIHLAG